MGRIFMGRGTRRQYTRNEIAKVLIELQSFEISEFGSVIYELKLDDDGNIMYDLEDYETTGIQEGVHYICLIYPESYGITDGSLDADFVYSHETMNCKAFADCVDELTEKANRWLKIVLN